MNFLKKDYASVSYMLLGVAVAVVPAQTVCPWTMEKGYMICWETAKAMIVLGAIMFTLGMLLRFVNKAMNKFMLHSLGLTAEVIGILMPYKFIGGCMNPAMSCHTVAYPFIYAVLASAIVVSVVMMCFSVKEYMKETSTAIVESK